MMAAMYKQIADDLRAKIEAGEPPQGSRLPAEIELMAGYEASRNTVRDAIKLLITRGLVETRPGQGTYVLKPSESFVSTLTGDPAAAEGESPVQFEQVRAGGGEPTVTAPRVEIQFLGGLKAQVLGLDDNSQVVSRHQQRLIDNTPWSLQTSFYPMRLVHKGAVRLIEAMDIPEGVMAYLATDLGIRQVGYRDVVTVRAPGEAEATFFQLPSRVSVFEIFRVAFDENGDRLRLTVTVLPADRNRLQVNVGQVPQRGGIDL
jgi:GntR family transcriptional regulator